MRTIGAVATAVLVVASLTGGSPAGAATLGKGTVELTPSVLFSRTSFSFSGADAGNLTVLSASTTLGYCMTDHFEVVGGLLVDYQSFDFPASPSESATSLGLTGGVIYNFSSGGQMIPFARVAVGFASNSGALSAGEETTVIAPALEAGLRYLVGSSASVNFGAGFQHRSKWAGVQDLSANTFGLNIGVSIFPRRH
jgi:hypothetical protein